MSGKSRKSISSTDLMKVLQEVSKKSHIKQTDTQSSFDFTLAISFLKENELDKYICFRTWERGFPSNSERGIYYSISNVIIRKLNIRFDSHLNRNKQSDWEPIFSWNKQSDWEPVFSFPTEWHFEECRFESPSLNMEFFSFPWRSRFRFYKNEFFFCERVALRSWSFGFETGSRVLFQKNDFKNSSIQIVCKSSERDSDLRHLRLGNLSFLGNKGIDRLELRCNVASYVFRGMNRINFLHFSELKSNSPALDAKIYIGSRERIDPYFDYPFHHRNLFLSLREYAGKKQDTHLVNVLDKQLDRVEYFLTKDQEISFFTDKREWFEYWQDRILYAWRRWSSDFYRSWLRPLSMVVLGYGVLNALPWFWIENFTFSDWIAFSLRPVSQIHLYAGSLEVVCGDEYKCLPLRSKNWLSFIGLLQMIWIAIWGFSFSKSIKR